jgi:hypothetical protein
MIDRVTTEGLHGLAEAVRSLNDIVGELVCGLAADDPVTKGYAYTVVCVLADHTRHLGGDPRIDERTVAGWEGEQ